MNLKTSRVDLWAAEIDDMPGGLAQTLHAIAEFGVELTHVIARRQPEQPGKGIVLVVPLTGKEHLENIVDVRLQRANGFAALRIEGVNEHGAGTKITRAISGAHVNMNALSCTVVGHRFVCYAIFDHAQDLEKADAALQALATHHWPFWHRHHDPKAA
jgi:ACT domain-containing protein